MLITYKTCKLIKKLKVFHQQTKFLSGIAAWNEELNAKVKHRIEEHWRERIKPVEFDENDNDREKFYVLSMFPYPSGKLHMGHVRVYTISDTVARFHRMNGKNVLQPIGWDAFGLPAENAAHQHKIPPKVWTEQNIIQMKQQLKQLACSFDWSRELSTCDPNYYKWTQYLFLKMFQEGLAYQKEALVNWDPVDKTVLAHEQVDERGFSWRSGAKVEKKLLKQWFIRTTKFAKQLLEGLGDPKLEDWRDIIKLQKHWIGQCDGVSFDFRLVENDSKSSGIITVWTSKPELISLAKFIAVKPESKLGKHSYEVVNGVKKLFVKAENPLTGESIPIFLTDEVFYGDFCDTYLGIPAGFEDDTSFARNVEIPTDESELVLTDSEVEKRQNEVCKKARELNAGGYWTSSKLQDWLISRQRYWGTPIPIIHCSHCGVQPVPYKDLPVLLPEVDDFNLTNSKDWITTKCPKCQRDAKRETDTMDTFVDSAWYYLRYLDPENSKEPFRKNIVDKMMPVDLYVGGKEHAVLHLYYARFFGYFLNSLGLLPEKEPFLRLLVQGMIMGESYRVKDSGKYISQSEVEILDAKKKIAVEKSTRKPVVISWEKMSKSKLNGVDPEEMFTEYGTDTTRLLVLADVAPTSQRNWSKSTFPGILNWQHRLWLTLSNFIKLRGNQPQDCPREEFENQEDKLFDSRNFYIKGATFNYYTSQQMSVAVSKMQGLTNVLRRAPPAVVARSIQFERALAAQIILLAPMAPHFASELWSGFQSAPNKLNQKSEDFDWTKPVLEQSWPQVDWDYKLDLVCQTNGSNNAIVKIPRKDLEKMQHDEAVEIALKQPEVQKYTENQEVAEINFKIYTGYQAVVNILTVERQQKLKQSN